MSTKKILIIEDEEYINNLMYEALGKEQYECTQAYSGTEAKMCLKTQEYDVILLDLMLPGMKGDQFLKELKPNLKTPVIIVSAIDDLDKKVDLLTLGAEDYITKPFEIKELLARVAVQIRRSEAVKGQAGSKEGKVLRHKELELNQGTYTVKVKNEGINLTRQEFKILELLLTYPNKVFSKQDIYEYAWDDFYVGEEKTINVHISNIRTKLKKVSKEDYIDTVWGIGFKLSC
ncbi:MAG: response regulator transcription factor [bacterium]|nr:response regulator transcription factor [bacterium]